MTEPEPGPDDEDFEYWDLIANLDEPEPDDPDEETADYRNGWPPKA